MTKKLGFLIVLFVALSLPAMAMGADTTSVPLSAAVALPSDSQAKPETVGTGTSEEQRKALKVKREERRLEMERRLEEIRNLSAEEKARRKAMLLEDRQKRQEARQERKGEHQELREQKREQKEDWDG